VNTRNVARIKATLPKECDEMAKIKRTKQNFVLTKVGLPQECDEV